MARGIIGVVVALLIGNPFCCCAIGLTLEKSSSKAPRHSCCQGKSDTDAGGQSSEPSSEHSGIPCRCGKNDRALALEKVAKPFPPEAQLVPAISFTGQVIRLPRPSPSVPLQGHYDPPWPGAGFSSLQILFGVFRC